MSWFSDSCYCMRKGGKMDKVTFQSSHLCTCKVLCTFECFSAIFRQSGFALAPAETDSRGKCPQHRSAPLPKLAVGNLLTKEKSCFSSCARDPRLFWPIPPFCCKFRVMKHLLWGWLTPSSHGLQQQQQLKLFCPLLSPCPWWESSAPAAPLP